MLIIYIFNNFIFQHKQNVSHILNTPPLFLLFPIICKVRWWLKWKQIHGSAERKIVRALHKHLGNLKGPFINSRWCICIIETLKILVFKKRIVLWHQLWLHRDNVLLQLLPMLAPAYLSGRAEVVQWLLRLQLRVLESVLWERVTAVQSFPNLLWQMWWEFWLQGDHRVLQWRILHTWKCMQAGYEGDRRHLWQGFWMFRWIEIRRGIHLWRWEMLHGGQSQVTTVDMDNHIHSLLHHSVAGRPNMPLLQDSDWNRAELFIEDRPWAETWWIWR